MREPWLPLSLHSSAPGHDKRNLSVFILENMESNIHHLLRVLNDLTTRGIWVRLLEKFVLTILHIGIVIWLVCLCLCSAFFFSSRYFYVFAFQLPFLWLCFSIFNSQISTSIKMWVNLLVRVSFVLLWVLGIDNGDENEDIRNKET